MPPPPLPPPMPPPMPPAGAGASFWGISATIASVVSRSRTPGRVLKGSPRDLGGVDDAHLHQVAVCAAACIETEGSSLASTLSTITAASSPAFSTIIRNRAWRASRMISTPNYCAARGFRPSSARLARRRATPPPGEFSSPAACVACSASSTRAFFSFISTSVAAPTLMMATPPEVHKRSWSFSRS